MEQITNYVKPELIVVAITLYFVGMALKQAQAVKDKPRRTSPNTSRRTRCPAAGDGRTGKVAHHPVGRVDQHFDGGEVRERPPGSPCRDRGQRGQSGNE